MSFTNQTGLELVYVSGVVRDQRSHAVPAGLGADAALTRLLRGTGLRYEYLTPRTVRILAIAPHASAALQDDEAQEVIVTANRRIEAAQDVPISIQVLTHATLAKLNVSTFDDFVGYLPGVTAHGVGPGQNNIYVRGLGAGETGTRGEDSLRASPVFAVYLDEQAVQLPNRNLDVYAADLERIEVLEGPQGTLFGAGAEAGVLRYITNEPKLNVTEGQANPGAGTTSHGGTSYAVTAMVNLPLITDRLAVRAVIYDDRRGGYIDNIPATFYRTPTDYGIAFYNGGVVPAGPVINNHALVGKAFNPVSYQGTRVEALYQFNDDWSALIAQSYQSMEADGVSAEMATNALGRPRPDLSVQLFNPSYNKDRFENTALTVNGHVGSLELLYAGSYLVRNVEQQEDYTAYSHAGFYVDYYQCINFSGNPYTADPNAQCFTPSAYSSTGCATRIRAMSCESDDTGGCTVRAVGGLFYERYTTQDQLDWYYLTAIPYFNPIGPPTGDYMLNGQVVCGCTQGAQFVRDWE